MELERACVVRSLAGRDKGRLLAVTRVSAEGIEVCDGKERPLERPKIKNPRHIEPAGIRLSEQEMAFNGRLRRALNRLSEEKAFSE